MVVAQLLECEDPAEAMSHPEFSGSLSAPAGSSHRRSWTISMSHVLTCSAKIHAHLLPSKHTLSVPANLCMLYLQAQPSRIRTMFWLPCLQQARHHKALSVSEQQQRNCNLLLFETTPHHY